jgi:RimJ/RimL family protein N-acetyltransferase
MTLDSLQVETPRLLMRVPRAGDLDPMAEMMADEETARFIGGVAPRSVTGRWVGRLGPWMPEGWPGPEVGWTIVRDCWGRGYATEGATAATDWAFDHLGWTRVIHSIDPANVASQVVARKLGSRNLGPGSLPAPFQDSTVDIWGQTREEWRARQR